MRRAFPIKRLPFCDACTVLFATATAVYQRANGLFGLIKDSMPLFEVCAVA